MAKDITPRISPLAAVLHPHFLPTHCSSCFNPLNSSSPSLCCLSCSAVRYCSPSCLAAESPSHIQSHECRLLTIGQNSDSSSDARAALRLIHSFQVLGFGIKSGTRVGGLLAGGVEKVLEERGEMAEKIVEGCRLMRRARGTRVSELLDDVNEEFLGEVDELADGISVRARGARVDGLLADGVGKVLEEEGELAESILSRGEGTRVDGLLAGGVEKVPEEQTVKRARVTHFGGLVADGVGKIIEDEVALWVVVTNGVEVQVGEIGSIGVAVYPPGFSWFNHSWSPNAWYRFDLNRDGSEDGSGGCFGVSGVGMAESSSDGEIVVNFEDMRSNCGFCRYGPKVIVRSIKPIMKGEEVCITYVDLLQPKERRQNDLWEKYRFSCSCKRCRSSEPTGIDFILICDARHLCSEKFEKTIDAAQDELDSFVEKAVAEYTENDNPEICCDMLERMLSETSQNRQNLKGKFLETGFKLHPLHYLSLTAYSMLGSAYKSYMHSDHNYSLDSIDSSKAFKVARASISYNLLFACAAHHLFMFEPSLVAIVAHCIVGVGREILDCLRSFSWWPDEESYTSELRFATTCFKTALTETSSLSLDELKIASSKFISFISSNLVLTWPFLAQGFSYLESIDNPVNFDWLGFTTHKPVENFSPARSVSPEDKLEDMKMDKRKKCLFQLAAQCLVYGGYLGSICYGPQSFLADQINMLM